MSRILSLKQTQSWSKIWKSSWFQHSKSQIFEKVKLKKLRKSEFRSWLKLHVREFQKLSWIFKKNSNLKVVLDDIWKFITSWCWWIEIFYGLKFFSNCCIRTHIIWLESLLELKIFGTKFYQESSEELIGCLYRQVLKMKKKLRKWWNNEDVKGTELFSWSKLLFDLNNLTIKFDGKKIVNSNKKLFSIELQNSIWF